MTTSGTERLLFASRCEPDPAEALSLKTVEQILIDSIEKRHILSILLGALAAAAVALAALGIDGVIS